LKTIFTGNTLSQIVITNFINLTKMYWKKSNMTL